MTSSSAFTAVTFVVIVLCAAVAVIVPQLLADFVATDCASAFSLEEIKWRTEAAFSKQRHSSVPPPARSSALDWRCEMASWFTRPFLFTAESSSGRSSTVPSIATFGLLAATALMNRNLVPLLVWTCGYVVLPSLRDAALAPLVLVALLSQMLAGAGVARNGPPALVPPLSLAGAALWALLLSSGACANPLLWSAVPLCLLLQTTATHAAKRKAALALSAVAAIAAAAIAYLVFAAHSAWAVRAVVQPLRAYAVALDAMEPAWMPGAIVGELLVYGFRSAAPSTVLFLSLLPCALVLVAATRLRSCDAETAFVYCMLCDPRTTLAHLVVAVVLLSRRRARSSGDADDNISSSGSKRTMRLFLPVVCVFIALISVAYFAAWAVYRSAQLNMSLYALFGVHLATVLFMLTDLELVK